MRDLLPHLLQWQQAGKKIALATVVRADGSAPRREGARLAVADSGELVGSVSGGCVEGDVFHHAQEVLTMGEPRLLHYAISDEMAWDVGLACGGTIEVWVEPLPEQALFARLASALEAGEPVAQVILLDGPGTRGARMLLFLEEAPVGALGQPQVEAAAREWALAWLGEGRGVAQQLSLQQTTLFIETFLPPPHLILFGGAHIAIALARFAKELDFQVTLIDPREQFANPVRFPMVDRIIPEWPDDAMRDLTLGPESYCVILTHDPKIDEPALLSVLDKGAAYIGAIGSRQTHAERFERMARHGVSAEALAQVYAPVGLDLGAVTPEEIALAIMAEIVAVRREGQGGFLRDK